MGFIVSLIVSLVIMVVGELLRPKQNPANAKPSSLDDFDVPTAEEGRSIPVIVGKVKINGPNVTYYGDLEVQPLKKKVKTGLFSSKKQTYAYRYKMGMQMFLCRAREDFEVHEIRFGDKMPAHTRTEEANGVVRFDFNDVNFFGGDEKEGGIAGTLRFYRGRQTQEPSAYFSARIGETAPGYRGYAYGMLEKMYLGTSAYIKPVGYIVSSYPNTLGMTANKHKIGEDANPVCFVYEILNDGVWGLNINPGRIDVASFIEAATTVFDEGYGISMIINSGSSAEDLISEVLRHIDGVIFTDPSTGLITIKLARADYDIETIPEYGPDDFVEGIKFSRASWSQTKNTIKASYISRENDYQEAIVSQQDLANIMQREGEIASETVDFRGFSHVDAANLACARALKTYSYPLAKATCALTRKAWTMRPGSVFKLNWPSRGIDDVVFRVVRIDYGNLKQNRIDIEAIEDIFAISKSAYLPPPPSGWVDPIQPPSAFGQQAVMELPYGMAPAQSNAYLATLAARNSGIDEGYDIWSNRGTGAEYRARNFDFTPTGVLVDAYPASTPALDPVGFSVNNLKHAEDIDAASTTDELYGGSRLAVINSIAGQEVVAYQYAADQGDGSFDFTNVIRGVYDTVPLSHPAGARVWFVSDGYGLENEDAPYLTARSVGVQLLGFNVRGVLPLISAPVLNIDIGMRANKPYPPANPKIDGTSAPPTVTGNATLTWAIRHRIMQDQLVVPQDAASVTATPEGGYRVDVWIDGAVRRTTFISTAPFDTFEYTTAMRAADYGNVQKKAKFLLSAYNGALTSVVRETPEFLMLDLLAPMSIAPGSLPVVVIDEPYSEVVVASGGSGEYNYEIIAGSLPAGFTFDEITHTFSGITSVDITESVTVRVTDLVTGLLLDKIYTLTTTAVPAGEFADEVLADSPTWFCRHNEGSGTTAINEVGDDGTYGGTPVFGAPELYPTGLTCWDLNGASYCDIPSAALPSPNQAITLEIMIKRKATITGFQAMIDRDQEGTIRKWQWRWEGGDDLQFIKIQDGVQTFTGTDIGPASDVGLFAVTIDATGAAKMYKNGVEVSSAAFTAATDYGSGTIGLRIGRRLQGDSQADYYCAESMIYPSALSAARLLAHAEAAGLA